MKNTILKILIVILLITGGAGASSLTLTGSILPPTLAGGVITDHSGFKYSSMVDGLYKIEYDGKMTYFGFGVSGTVGTNNFKKLSSDYFWSRSVTTQTNGYTAIATSTTGEWQTEFTFTNRKTKINNKITNNLANPITNAKFYYLFTVSAGDLIQYQGETHIISASPNIHKSGNLNEQIPQVIINDQVLFDFQDIISSGFNITDVYIVPASSLGFTSSYNVIAIAFTKGTGNIQPGETIIIDPSLEQSGGSVTLYGNQSYEYVNITNGGVLYIAAYNGTSGTGTLNLTVAYNLTVDATSSINGAKRGYRGGAGAPAPYGCAYGGELAGYGGGSNAGTCGSSDITGGAGGGGYATTGGSGGCAGQGCSQAGGAGGSAQGTISGWDIQMGNGGGGGGGGSSGAPAAPSGEAGGAMLTLNVSGNTNISGSLIFTGGVGGNGGSGGTWGGGGGGGASGGGILINGTNVNISSATLTTAGGAGGSAIDGGSSGGSGSGGRIKIFYHTLVNTSTTITSGSTYYGLLNTAPTVPVLYSPASGYLFNSTQTIALVWLQSTDVNGDNVTYDWAVDGVTQDTGISTNSTSTVLAEGSHNWSVRAYDGTEYSAWATVETFSIALIPDIITDPICTHGGNYITCTWTDPTDANFDHVYITNMTGTNNSWDSNITAGVQTKTWSNMPKGTYSYKAQSVTTLGVMSSNFTWINSTVNNYSFVFSGKALSATSIYQSSGTETISVNVNDSDGTITNVTMTLTYFGVPFVYNMVHGSGDSWSYGFSSSNVGAYYVASFNATDDYSETSGVAWGQSFIVTPVVGGGSPGGGGSPSGSVSTPAPAVTTTHPTAPSINFMAMKNDETGILILQSGMVIGALMMVYAWLSKNTTAGTLIWGLIICLVSAYGMGWIA